ncbi:DMT family transporter [Actinoplanes sp. NPDC051861]|uniref:DMT family transporter n=1 Tax=Actinoplanes sp. NPDC051861 TaxID=3155170 RepID=UPI0034198D7C
MGPLLCLVSAACFGAMAIFGKLAFDAGVSPGALLLVRFGLAAFALSALIPLQPGARPGRRALLIAVGLGAWGYALQATLYFTALQLMDAALLSLIFYTYPILVTVAAVLLGRDRLTRARGTALVAASCGTLLVLAGTGAVALSLAGVLAALGSAVTYTVYIMVADRVVHTMPPLTLSALVMTGATLALGTRAAVTGGVDLGFTARGWLWVACIALVSTVCAIVTFFAGLRRTGPSTAAILSTFEPVVTMTLAGLVLGESLTGVQLAGGLLVLASAAMLQWRKSNYNITKVAV